MYKSQKEKLIDYNQVFGSPAGRKVLYDIMRCANVLHSSFVRDPYETAFNEGQRNVVLRILKVLKEDPAKFEKRIEQGESEYE